MRRVTTIAIGYAIVAFALSLVARTTPTWVTDWLTQRPGVPLPAPMAALAKVSGSWWMWGPWITLLVAITLGATAFLTRPRGELAAEPSTGIDLAPAPPRIWPSLLAGVFAMPISLAVGMALLAVFVILRSMFSGTSLPDTQGSDIFALRTSAGAFLFLAIAVEATLALIVLGLARRSPVALRERLALRPPRLRWWAWPVLAAATLAAHTVGTVVVGTLIGEPPEALLHSFDMLTKLQGAMAVVALLVVSVPPGFAEELLFRGYVQTRFVQRWGAATAIGLAALLFAVAHGDLIYAMFVLPIGLWLGWVAWSTRSVIPAMFCHAMNNFVLMSVAMLWSEQAPANQWFQWNTETVGLFVLSLVILAASITAITKHGRLAAAADADAPHAPA